ncbi:hypothetical protein CWE09_02945 [Aliidiomarina minuta]|uniref:DUF3466 domain-containing protein n=1 Tax=Aliidiomarina minuta TaxID=880057 RepID=A0A432W6J6_9GAMM|nr:DUF3466 family protein [Aliidiomarina minuta]RUO25703.1 hypothetical protein CWE09_02945 [Aliidiomarina minuta]
MIKKYSISLVAASVIASASLSVHANEGYDVVDLGTLPDAVSSNPQRMNEDGLAVVQNSNLWNQNIRFDLLDPELFHFIDPENPTDSDYRIVRSYLNNYNGSGASPALQKLGTVVSHVYDTDYRELTGFDQIDPETGEYTDSVNVRALDINIHGSIVGQATKPYERRMTTDREGEQVEYFIRDSFPQGFIKINEEITYLQSDADVFNGGVSSATSVNYNPELELTQVVGYASVAHSSGLENRITTCTTLPDDYEEGDAHASKEELTVCVWRSWLQREVATTLAGSNRQPIFIEQAYIWEFDNSGAMVNARTLGSLEEVEDGDSHELRSSALDINDAGIAVGRSGFNYEAPNGATVAINTAVVFRDDQIIDILKVADNPDDLSVYGTGSNAATAISNSNMVVGYSNRRIGFSTRERLFFYDLNDPQAEAVFPLGFYANSSWRPRAINNHNMVVGRTDTTAQSSGLRPTVGFLYDINTDEITDLNTLLPCGSEYRIVDALDINDDGEILAMGTTVTEIDIDGEAVEQNALRALRLQPSSAEPCGVDERVERQGAALHPLLAGVMALIAVLLITRRRLLRRK